MELEKSSLQRWRGKLTLSSRPPSVPIGNYWSGYSGVGDTESHNSRFHKLTSDFEALKSAHYVEPGGNRFPMLWTHFRKSRKTCPEEVKPLVLYILQKKYCSTCEAHSMLVIASQRGQCLDWERISNGQRRRS